MVGVSQEDASRIGRCRGAPIQSGISSELATELLPASLGCLIKRQNRCIEWCRMDNAPRAGTTVSPLHLHEVQHYHPCTCTRCNGHLPRCDFSIKTEFHKRTTSRYNGGTVVPPAVPPEGTNMVPSCLLDSARGALSTPSEPLSLPGTQDCDHTQPQLILNAQQTSIQGKHLVWVSPPYGERDSAELPKRKRTKN